MSERIDCIQFGTITTSTTVPSTTTGKAIERGGTFLFQMSGTPAGVSLQLKHRPAGHADFNDVAGAVLAAAGDSHEILVADADEYQVESTGATGSTSVIATMNRVTART